MTCRHCGIEIADKAIVCYRCGTPTADLPSPRLQGSRPGVPPWVWVVVVVVIVAGAVLAYYWAAPAA
ncbi:MAG TPA: hypothetical protein VMS54_13605 [Vicinamibacterales bacterium]|nr:hypothetical protein [Vicinamibacterales bacterium]